MDSLLQDLRHSPRSLRRNPGLSAADFFRTLVVSPRGLRWEGDVDLWTPLITDSVRPRRADFLTLVGRLRPGSTISSAQQELAVAARDLTERYPDSIVGIVGDVRHERLDRAPYPQLYLPMAQSPERRMVITARLAGDPMRVAAALRRGRAEIDPDVSFAACFGPARRAARSDPMAALRAD